MFNLGPMEMLIIMGLMVLLFGKRLPEVSRSLGKGIIEFRKGLHGVADDLDSSSATRYGSSSSHYGSSRQADDSSPGGSTYSDTSVPKFELPGTVSSPAPNSATTPQMDYQPEAPRD
jgi:sec-independent protein translocase protein TatA